MYKRLANLVNRLPALRAMLWHLQALVVVRVDHVAGASAGTSRAASIPSTATLLVLHDGRAATGVARGRRNRPGRSRQRRRRARGLGGLRGAGSRSHGGASLSSNGLGSAGDHSRAGGDVGVEVLVDVDLDAGVGRPVRAGERHARGVVGATARDGELVARNVELGTTSTARSMQGNSLSPQQIVTRRQVAGDADIHLAAVGIEVLGAPEVVRAGATGGVLGPSVLEDLEEGGAAVSGGGVGDLGHVDQDRAVVGAADGFLAAVAGVVLVHFDGYGAACGDGALSGDGAGVGVALSM